MSGAAHAADRAYGAARGCAEPRNGTVVYVAPGKSTAVAMALLVTVEDPIAGAVTFSFRARYLAI